MARDWSLAAVFGALFLLVFPVVVGLAFLAGPTFARFGTVPSWAVALVVVVALTAAVVAARRRRPESSDVWEVIPSWQYTGRHAESGGLARDEQEAALTDIEEQVEAHERRSR